MHACICVCVCSSICLTHSSHRTIFGNQFFPFILQSWIEPRSSGLAAGASLLSCLSLIFHLFDDGRYSSSSEVMTSLQYKSAFLKQLGTDLVTGFNRSVDHLYDFF